MSADLLQFLATVDGTEKFVARAVEALAKNDITEVYELRGADADVIRKHVGQMTGGLHAFIDTACDKYKTYVKAQKAEKDNGIIATRISAVEEALGPKLAKPTVHINLDVEIQKLSLRDLPSICGPRSLAVDTLATEISKKQEKDGIKEPFIYMDLEKFLPSWCPNVSEEESAKDFRKGKVMDITLWSIAFDKYAMAAACTRQLTLANAIAHKDVCFEVAMTAHNDGLGRLLGAYYDEACRRAWAERSVCGDRTFCVGVEAGKLCESTLRKARAKYHEDKSRNFLGKGKGKAANYTRDVQAVVCHLYAHYLLVLPVMLFVSKW